MFERNNWLNLESTGLPKHELFMLTKYPDLTQRTYKVKIWENGRMTLSEERENFRTSYRWIRLTRPNMASKGSSRMTHLRRRRESSVKWLSPCWVLSVYVSNKRDQARLSETRQDELEWHARCWKELKQHASKLSELHQLCPNIGVKDPLEEKVPCSHAGLGLALAI